MNMQRMSTSPVKPAGPPTADGLHATTSGEAGYEGALSTLGRAAE